MREKIEIGIFVLVCLLVGWYYTFVENLYIIDIKLFLEKTPVYFLPTLILSILGIYLAFRNYWRKSGVDVAANYQITSDYSSNDSYISSIILANRKDKPLIIKNFYIRIAENIFIKLNSSDDEYITLKPYESLLHKFPPQLGYLCNGHPVINLMDTLHDEKVKRRIVLDTIDGIVTCSALKFSNVMLQALTNYSTAYIEGINGKFIGKDEWPIGNNVLYFIELTTKDDMDASFTISPDPNKIYFEGQLSFDADLLWSDKGKDHVRDVIQHALDQGTFSWKSFEIHSQLKKLERLKQYSKYDKLKIIDLSNVCNHDGFFKYHVLGKLRSFLKDR